MFGTGDVDWENVDWNSYNKPKSIILMSDVRAISAGPMQYLVEKNDGTVWTWGCHEERCLGDGQFGTQTFGTTQFIKLEFTASQGEKKFFYINR